MEKEIIENRTKTIVKCRLTEFLMSLVIDDNFFKDCWANTQEEKDVVTETLTDIINRGHPLGNDI